MGTPSDGLGCRDSRPAGRPAPTPLTSHGRHATASLFEGGLAFTRRAVLGAAVAVPVAAGVGSDSERPSPPKPSAWVPPLPRKAGEEKWAEALTAYREARAAQDRFDLATREATAGPRGRSFAEQKKMDDRFGDYLVASCKALRKLMRTPAPDLGALGVKIALVVDERGWELTGGERGMKVLKADARRLLPRASS